jgi:hypothetical protein
LGAGSEDKPSHVHHSSFEVNDFDTQTLGHDWLRGKGWTNCWGIGRHVLGSQIFDYWYVYTLYSSNIELTQVVLGSTRQATFWNITAMVIW